MILCLSSHALLSSSLLFSPLLSLISLSSPPAFRCPRSSHHCSPRCSPLFSSPLLSSPLLHLFSLSFLSSPLLSSRLLGLSSPSSLLYTPPAFRCPPFST